MTHALHGHRYASLIAFALFMGACGGSVPPSPTSASPVTTVASVNPPAPEAVAPPGPVAPAPRVAAGTIASLAVEPARFRGGETPVGTVTLTAPAPAGGTVVTLTSSDRDVRPPATLTIPAGQTIGMFQIATSEPHADTDVRVTATTTDGTATTDILLVLPAPGARTDSYTMTGNTLTVPAPGVLDNDTRRTGHELTAELHTAPISGTVLLNANGGFTYRPHANFTGTDRFIYRAVDGATGSNLAHVWITINSPGSPVAGTPAPTPTGSQTFSSGLGQTFTVPNGVTTITIEASGAQGGRGFDNGGTGGAGGLGGTTQATFSVVPGTTYQVNVGTRGGDGDGSTDGGGGGGASDVRSGAFALSDRVIVAGGGGGGGGAQSAELGGVGGAGGGLTGGTGADSTSSTSAGGGGGTQVAGGFGGPTAINTGLAGTLGVGGNACCNILGGPGGTNGGAPGNTFAGGGGGGFYGGGGGGVESSSGPGGGGGSSFAEAGATNVTHQQGVRSGNGQVIIRW